MKVNQMVVKGDSPCLIASLTFFGRSSITVYVLRKQHFASYLLRNILTLLTFVIDWPTALITHRISRALTAPTSQ
jgi:hypothetical protein